MALDSKQILKPVKKLQKLVSKIPAQPHSGRSSRPPHQDTPLRVDL